MNRIPEHTIVKLLSPVKTAKTLVPIGSQGTIVHVYPEGYEVEFPSGGSSQVIYCPEGSVVTKKG